MARKPKPHLPHPPAHLAKPVRATDFMMHPREVKILAREFDKTIAPRLAKDLEFRQAALASVPPEVLKAVPERLQPRLAGLFIFADAIGEAGGVPDALQIVCAQWAALGATVVSRFYEAEQAY